MVTRFAVPKFITIEDRLAGLFTFRQLFALLGAFLLTFFVFRANPFLGIIVGSVSFSLAFLFTFYYVNGKPFIFIVGNVFDYFLRGRKYVWQRIEKFTYKEVELTETEETPLEIPFIKKREKKIVEDKIPLEIKYPEVAPEFRERITLSLTEPLSEQVKEFDKIIHRHLVNPKNPYRFFPYIKFYRSLK